MKEIIKLDKDSLRPVEVFWSDEYAMPVFIVGSRAYIPDTGEFAGYYTLAKVDSIEGGDDVDSN